MRGRPRTGRVRSNICNSKLANGAQRLRNEVEVESEDGDQDHIISCEGSLPFLCRLWRLLWLKGGCDGGKRGEGVTVPVACRWGASGWCGGGD